MREGYSHLPEDLAAAIDRYERDKKDGTLRFTHDGEFAEMPADHIGGWIQDFLASHLPDMDATPRDSEVIDYNRGTHPAPIPHRADGQEIRDGVTFCERCTE